MMSRRNALLAGIGLAGIAAYARNLFALGAHVGAEKFEVSKTEAEWKQVLTPEQFQVLRSVGRSGHIPARSITSIAPVCSLVRPAICRSFAPKPNSIAALAGRAFSRRSRTLSAPRTITACSFHERKCIAGAAAVISATCSTTGPSRLGSATA